MSTSQSCSWKIHRQLIANFSKDFSAPKTWKNDGVTPCNHSVLRKAFFTRETCGKFSVSSNRFPSGCFGEKVHKARIFNGINCFVNRALKAWKAERHQLVGSRDYSVSTCYKKNKKVFHHFRTFCNKKLPFSVFFLQKKSWANLHGSSLTPDIKKNDSFGYEFPNIEFIENLHDIFTAGSMAIHWQISKKRQFLRI